MLSIPVFLFFVVIATTQTVEVNYCNDASSEQVLDFDDITLNGTTPRAYLPQPYRGEYLFERITSRAHLSMDVLNTSSPGSPAAYRNVASSPTNVILTSTGSLSLNRLGNTFTLLTLKMTSIFKDQMPIFVNASRNGVVMKSLIVNLPLLVNTEIVVNQKNIDQVLIGCLYPSLHTCAHIAYDDIGVCK